MKKTTLVLWLATGLAWLAGAGCAHIDTTPGGDVDRAIAGTVNFRGDLVLPPDAEVVVRLIDAMGPGQALPPPSQDLPVANRPRAVATEQVLGEQTIKAPAAGPVPFRIEYTADDAMLRHGLNLDARISFGGRVQFRTVTTRAVTLGNATDKHEIWVQAVAR